MDLTLSSYQQTLKERLRSIATAGFPPSGDENENALHRTYGDVSGPGLLNWQGSTGGEQLDLSSLVLSSVDLARSSPELALLVANRFLCYRASLLFADDEVRAEVLRRTAPLDVLFIWPDSGFAFPASHSACFNEEQNLLSVDETVVFRHSFSAYYLGFAAGPRQHFVFATPAAAGTAPSHSTLNLLGLNALKFERLSWQAPVARPVCLVPIESPVWNFFCAVRTGLYSAVLLGIAESAAAYALEYSKQRITFRRPLVQHQSVATQIADMYTALEGARLLLLEACVSLDQSPEDTGTVGDAWNYLQRVALDVVIRSVQILGGHGFLTFHPAEKHLRDAQTVRLLQSEAGSEL
jgi:hypothetical protein